MIETESDDFVITGVDDSTCTPQIRTRPCRGAEKVAHAVRAMFTVSRSQLQSEQADTLVEGIFPIDELPDISTIQGLVTRPIWLERSDVFTTSVLLALTSRIQSLDEIRILFDRGYFSSDNVRLAWALLNQKCQVDLHLLNDADALRFDLAPEAFAFFQTSGILAVDGVTSGFSDRINGYKNS